MNFYFCFLFFLFEAASEVQFAAQWLCGPVNLLVSRFLANLMGEEMDYLRSKSTHSHKVTHKKKNLSIKSIKEYKIISLYWSWWLFVCWVWKPSWPNFFFLACLCGIALLLTQTSCYFWPFSILCLWWFLVWSKVFLIF